MQSKVYVNKCVACITCAQVYMTDVPFSE